MSASMNAARSQYRLEDMEIKNALGKNKSTCTCACAWLRGTAQW